MRNAIIDNLRGLCLLGVIGIHAGSLALAPGSFALYCWLEILSRYSVPAFFFISGYGLCLNDKGLLTGAPLDYASFMKKRLLSAGLPYLSWSFFYLLYFWLTLPPGYISWEPLHVAFVLFFGLACYHLYFMVILLWFYACYPLWRCLLRLWLQHSFTAGLLLLLAFQLSFNWWTTHPGLDASHWSPLLRSLFSYRLNYLPLHYLLIFLCGGYAACCWKRFSELLRQHAAAVSCFFLAATAWQAGSAWYSYKIEGYSLLDLANTYHQLSPQGLVYTIASLLCFCLALQWLERHSLLAGAGSPVRLLQRAVSLLSANSMLIYFIHPLLLEWLTSFYSKYGIIMTVKKAAFSYLLLVLASLAASMLLSRLFLHSNLLSLLFTGKRRKRA